MENPIDKESFLYTWRWDIMKLVKRFPSCREIHGKKSYNNRYVTILMMPSCSEMARFPANIET